MFRIRLTASLINGTLYPHLYLISQEGSGYPLTGAFLLRCVLGETIHNPAF